MSAPAPEPQLCGADTSPEYSLWFECGLLPGHAGDHEGTYMWPNEPHGPALPSKPPTPQTQWLQAVYENLLAAQLDHALHGGPFVNRDRVLQVVNRDQL